MAGTDSSLITTKLWGTLSTPRSTVVVPGRVNCLPSALRSVVCVRAKLVCGRGKHVRMTEPEAPESNNTCTELSHILPNTHAVLIVFVFSDSTGTQSALTKVWECSQLSVSEHPLFLFPAESSIGEQCVLYLQI